MVVTRWVDPAADIGSRSGAPSKAEAAATLANVESALSDTDKSRKRRTVEVLSHVGDASTGKRVAALLASTQDDDTRLACSKVLSAIGRPAVPEMLAIIHTSPGAARDAAADALGAVGAEVVPEVAGLLDADDPDIRAVAVRALESMFLDRDGQQRKAASLKLGQVGGPSTAKAMSPLLGSKDWRVRQSISRVFATIGLPSAPALIEVFRSGNEVARTAAVEALSSMGEDVVPLLVPAFHDSNSAVHEAAARALERIAAAGSQTAKAALYVDELEAAMEEQMRKDAELARLGRTGLLAQVVGNPEADGSTRKAAVVALREVGEEAIPVVRALLDSEDWRTRRAAEQVLGERVAQLDDQRGGKTVVALAHALGRPATATKPEAFEVAVLLHHQSGEVRAAAADFFRELGPQAAAYSQEICLLLQDSKQDVRLAAASALLHIGDDCLPALCRQLDTGSASEVWTAQVLAQASGHDAKVAGPMLSERSGYAPSSAAAAVAHATCGSATFALAVPEAVAALLKDPEAEVREAATQALRRMRKEADEGIGVASTEPLAEDPSSIHQGNTESQMQQSAMSWWALSESEAGAADCEQVAPRPFSAVSELSALGTTDGCCTEARALELLSDPAWFAQPAARRSAVETLGFAAAAGTLSRDCSREVAVLLRDNDAQTRRAAAEALGRMAGGPTMEVREVHAQKAAALLRDSDGAVRAAAAEALGFMDAAGARHANRVAVLLGDNQAYVRRAAALSLGCMQSEDGAGQAAVYLKDTSPSVRGAAACALGEMRLAGAAHATAVAELLADGSEHVRTAAVWAIPRMGLGGAPRAAVLLAHREPRVRACAVKALGKMGGAGGADAAALLDHRDVEVRRSALAALGAMGPGAAEHVPAIAAMLDRPCSCALQDRWPVRLEAARAMGQVGEAGLPHTPKVLVLLHDDHPGVRAAAATALGLLAVTAASVIADDRAMKT